MIWVVSRMPAAASGFVDRANGGDTQRQQQHDGTDAEGAVPAVAHDGEAILDGVAAEEAVGGVGEGVLAHPAGDDHGGGDGKRCGEQVADPEPLEGEEDRRRPKADDEAGEGQGERNPAQLRTAMRTRPQRQP